MVRVYGILELVFTAIFVMELALNMFATLYQEVPPHHSSNSTLFSRPPPYPTPSTPPHPIPLHSPVLETHLSFSFLTCLRHTFHSLRHTFHGVPVLETHLSFIFLTSSLSSLPSSHQFVADSWNLFDSIVVLFSLVSVGFLAGSGASFPGAEQLKMMRSASCHTHTHKYAHTHTQRERERERERILT